ncbi:MAG: SGNH/GDSL hydrolase family protein [Planctomycetes bacterium]|nr:SGNH/GDSL hydrolase family protein [Planctomycetota bacterium]
MPDWAMTRDALRAMNDMIREVARETRSPLFDIDAELERKQGYYPLEDTDHFTDAGCRAVGRLFAEAIHKQQLLKGAALPK